MAGREAHDAERERRFLELIDANRPALARIARAYAGADWADLHQDILLQIWKGLDRFEGRSSAATWLYRVALNTALTWRRTTSRGAARTVGHGDVPEPAGSREGRDPVALLQEFLQTLTPIDRAVLVLYLEDTSYDDIAAVTGLTRTHVGVRVHRIKRAFKERYIEAAPPGDA